MVMDVTIEDQWKNVISNIEKDIGSLNILVNNAGIGGGGDVESTDLESWHLVHSVNLDSVFLGCKFSLPLMRKSGNGSIINISSMSGIVASHNMSAYNSSKAAVRHLSKSIALHCAKSTNLVRCNSIHPVFTRTAMVQSMIDAAPERNIEEKLVQQIPLRKLAEPIDIANAALFLASDESSFITGTELVIDGGLSAT
jgi:NAD(P)-dependent dehydrogenase (short-subunit alcohol dehydrogenase family)